MMRLTDLAPHWVNLPQAATGVKLYIGVSFLCPTDDHIPCPTCGAQQGRRLAVSFWPPIDPENLLGRELVGNFEQGTSRYHKRVSGETFDTLTITPSIELDSIWHGNITNGDITPAKTTGSTDGAVTG
jgi:hypothetical protein